MVDIVPGRSCGECNACCAFYDLMADLNKPCGSLCQHWKSGVGCGIYEDRPKICRDYHCHWLQNPTLDDSWRPDRSGILIRETVSDIPAHFEQRRGLVFELAGPDYSLEDDRVLHFVASMIHQRVPVFLSILGPMGFGNTMVLLNGRMATAVESRNRERLVDALRGTLAFLRLP